MCDKEIFSDNIRAKLHGNRVDTNEFLDDCVDLMLNGYSGARQAVSATLTHEHRSVLVKRLAEVDGVALGYKAPAIHTAVYPQIQHGLSTEVKSRKETKMGAFKYIPYPPSSFAQTMSEILPIVDMDAVDSFMDVGCGIGDKSLLAHSLLGFERAFGIEINSHTIELARWHINPLQGQTIYHWKEDREDSWYEDGGIAENGITLIQGDAFDYNFGLHEFIYSYVPISNPEMMVKLWQHILDTMPDGGWYVEVRGYHDFFNELIQDDSVLDDEEWEYRFCHYHVVRKVDGVPRLLDNNAIAEGYIEYL